MRMTWSAKKASPLLNVNTLVGNDRTDPIFIYQTWIFCKKNGSNRSFLPEIGAQTFCYIPWRVTTAYSIDIANWVGQSTNLSPPLISSIWRPDPRRQISPLWPNVPMQCNARISHYVAGTLCRPAQKIRKRPLPPFWKKNRVIFTRSPSTEGDRVYKLKICLSVSLSSLQNLEYRYRPFISSQDHARPHISYTAGQRMMSAVIWRCQWHTQRQIHRQRQIQSSCLRHSRYCN